MKPTKSLLQIYRFEGQNSNHLLWFPAQHKPYNLIWSCLHQSFILCLIWRSPLKRQASSWKTTSHAEATVTLWGFFQRLIYPFWKRKGKKKDKTCLISNPKVFSINIFNENSFPSVGIHPGGTLLQNTCPPWSLLRKNTLFLIPKPRLFPNNKRTSRLSEAQMIQAQELFFSHWLENIVMKKSELKKKITSIFPINEDLHRNVERILKQSILMLLAAGPLSRTKM